jgi:hypothetical protein
MHPILTETLPEIDKLPGGHRFHSNLNLCQYQPEVSFRADGIIRIDNFLKGTDVQKLLNLFDAFENKINVSSLGLVENYSGKYKGSDRITLWAPELSHEIYNLIKNYLCIRELNDYSRTDWWQHKGSKKWSPIGLSPLLRFMSYSKGAVHLPHYDAAFFYPEKKFRTLMSVIIYLSTHKLKSATRILNDGQEHLPEWERAHYDQDEIANNNFVRHHFYPQAGSVLLFDHRFLHDTEIHTESKKRILIRTDLVYEQI